MKGKKKIDPLPREKKKPKKKEYPGTAHGDTKGKDIYR